jgi:acyl-coenzyme A thioesterase PaaI-like protein
LLQELEEEGKRRNRERVVFGGVIAAAAATAAAAARATATTIIRLHSRKKQFLRHKMERKNGSLASRKMQKYTATRNLQIYLIIR